MGNFGTHFCVGLAHVVLGLRWLYCTLLRYFLCCRSASLSKSHATQYKTSMTFPSRCWPGAPTDGYFILVVSIIDFVQEFGGSFSHSAGIGFRMNGTHMTMTVFYMIVALVIILRHYRMFPIPDAEYAFMIIAQLMNAFAFWFHSYGKNLVEAQMHLLLAVLALVSCGFLMGEMMNPSSIISPLGRSAIFICMGTSMATIGFVLYPPTGEQWDLESIETVVVTSMMFMWNVSCVLTISFFVGMFILFRIGRMTPTDVNKALEFSYSFKQMSEEQQCGQVNYMKVHSEDEEC